MNYAELKNWIKQHDVKEKTESGFFELVNNLLRKSPHKVKRNFGEDFNQDMLSVTFYKAALTVRVDLDEDFDYIAAYADVKYNGEDKGVYKLIFNINGEIEDDYWLDRDD